MTCLTCSSSMFSPRVHNSGFGSRALGLGSRLGQGPQVVVAALLGKNGVAASSLSAEMTPFTKSLTSPQVPLMMNELLDFAQESESGMMVENGQVYRQHFPVKSLDVGPGAKMTMAALMNHLQDTSFSHGFRIGIMEEGFGGTSYMRRNNLRWVITSTQVEVERYPAWGDVFVMDHWLYESGKNMLGNGWLIRDGKTGQVLVRASNVCVLMNLETRRLSKFVKEVRDEFTPHFKRHPDCVAVAAPREEQRKIQRVSIESADNIRTSIQPSWYDLDINNHVGNIKYIDWIIGGAPGWVVESRELCEVRLEYKKECRIDDVGLQSMSKLITEKSLDHDRVELDHLLCLQDGSEIMRARTVWRPNSNSTPTFSVVLPRFFTV